MTFSVWIFPDTDFFFAQIVTVPAGREGKWRGRFITNTMRGRNRWTGIRLIPPRERAYFADFVYRDKAGNCVAEDAKGVRTKEYVIKRKLMLHVYGIRITEI